MVDIDISKLAEPATVLIQKISDAVIGFTKPWQMKRIAKAEIEVEKIRKFGEMELNEIDEEIFKSMIQREAQLQSNFQNVVRNSMGLLHNNSKPDSLDNDWISYFFEKSRLTSDEGIQELWGAILAGQANNPGSFSKKTIDLISHIDKKEAEIFEKICRFVWILDGRPEPVIYNFTESLYTESGITFSDVAKISDAGLIQVLSGNEQFSLTPDSDENMTLEYFGKKIKVNSFKVNPITSGYAVPFGKIRFTTSGSEIHRICRVDPIENNYDYVIKKISDSVEFSEEN